MTLGFLLLFLAVRSDVADTPKPPTLAEAVSVTPVLDRNGRLWLAWVHGQTLWVNWSDDLGKTLSKPVAVNPEPQTISAHGENRPALLVAGNGEVLVAYTQALPAKWSGDLMFSRSTDGGVSFAAPRKINDDTQVTSHAFVTMNQGPDGTVYLAWLDGRDRLAAQAESRPFTGSSLYGTSTKDGGRTFAANQSLVKETCQCCRLAMTFNGKGRPVVLWRHIFGDHIRDHGIGVWEAGGFSMRRFHQDGWRLEGCPHQGPAMITQASGAMHAAWFTTREDKATLLYAGLNTDGEPMGEPRVVAEGMHPALAAVGTDVYLAWMGSDEADAIIQWRVTRDSGRTWTSPAEAARTSGTADYPFLLQREGRVYCFWFAEGRIHLIPLVVS